MMLNHYPHSSSPTHIILSPSCCLPCHCTSRPTCCQIISSCHPIYVQYFPSKIQSRTAFRLHSWWIYLFQRHPSRGYKLITVSPCYQCQRDTVAKELGQLDKYLLGGVFECKFSRKISMLKCDIYQTTWKIRPQKCIYLLMRLFLYSFTKKIKSLIVPFVSIWYKFNLIGSRFCQWLMSNMSRKSKDHRTSYSKVRKKRRSNTWKLWINNNLTLR